VLVVDGSSEHLGWQNDPFGEDFFLPPYLEEVKERARIVREHNQDAVRHFVEVLAWETYDHPELRRWLIPLVWLLKEVDRRWIAEALSMSVRDVCALVEANSPWFFNCFDCGTEIRVKDRHHLWLMNDSLQAICDKIVIDENHLKNLLCSTCVEHRARDEEEQRLLDQARQQAILAEYRKGPYAERRRSEEWLILKRRVHRRDGYRCRMCGRDDLPLHLHHCTYVNYGQEKLEDVITLCEVCHRRHHLEDAS
jgi:hypothetical protein